MVSSAAQALRRFIDRSETEVKAQPTDPGTAGKICEVEIQTLTSDVLKGFPDPNEQLELVKRELQSIRSLHDNRIQVLEGELSKRDGEVEAQKQQISNLINEAQRYKDEMERLRSSIRLQKHQELTSHRRIQQRIEERVQQTLSVRSASMKQLTPEGTEPKQRQRSTPSGVELAFRPLRYELPNNDANQ